MTGGTQGRNSLAGLTLQSIVAHGSFTGTQPNTDECKIFTLSPSCHSDTRGLSDPVGVLSSLCDPSQVQG